MGNQTGKDKTNDQIEKKMKESQFEDMNNHSLLLLGPGESGKSTMLRQMRHIWGKQFQTKERQNYQKIIWINVTECIQILCTESLKLCETDKECQTEEKNKELIEFAMKLNTQNVPVFTEKICQCFKTLWADSGIQNTFTHRAKFYIMDSAEYWMENLAKFIGAEYTPTFEDICHCKVRTTGIMKENFVFNNVLFTVYDVGGQRSERRKWLNVCDNVRAIIYVTSLAGYNQVIFEDQETNRLIESFNVYNEYVNHKAFKKINIILFLNKSDLFDEMIKSVPFTVCPCDDFKSDPKDKDEIVKYIISAFQKRTSGYDTGQRSIFPHITCATNTEDVKAVFTTVRHIIIKSHLQDSAILK